MDRQSGAGFTTVVSVVEGLEAFAGYRVRVQAKNENYVAEKLLGTKEPEILACTPDLISLVDSESGTQLAVVFSDLAAKRRFWCGEFEQ